jgi:serine/threonine protein kinase
MWNIGLTLFESYFGELPYGSDANTKIMNDMIYDEKKFVYRKSEIPTLDILLRRLLQINPDNRMDSSEFYDYVTNENFLKSDVIAINDDMKYLNLYQEIINSPQIEYKDKLKQEKLNEKEKQKQNMQKILGFVEEGNLPDIMNFSNGIINEEEKFNNIIYYDNNIKINEEDTKKKRIL